MRTLRFKLTALAVVALGALGALWAWASVPPPIRLRILQLTSDSHGLWAPPIGSQRAYAIIEAANTGNRPVIYRSPLTFMPARTRFARNIVAYQDSSGWVPHPVHRLS
jgi:hypothetical protein